MIMRLKLLNTFCIGIINIAQISTSLDTGEVLFVQVCIDMRRAAGTRSIVPLLTKRTTGVDADWTVETKTSAAEFDDIMARQTFSCQDTGSD